MGDEKKAKSVGVWPTVKPFVNGGLSGMLATCVIQPIDMVKVQQIFRFTGYVCKWIVIEQGFVICSF